MFSPQATERMGQIEPSPSAPDQAVADSFPAAGRDTAVQIQHQPTVRQTDLSLPAPDRAAAGSINAAERDTEIRSIAQTRPQPRETARQLRPELGSPSGRGRRRPLRGISACFKGLATFAIVLLAVIMALMTWNYYVTAPWTRDGRVRVQVASVAPEVSGQITELRVGDNQYVHKGDVLYVINPFDFEVALRVGNAQSQERAADLQVKQVQSERRQLLSDLAVSKEQQQIFAGSAVQAKAAFEAAQQQVAQAEINLRRTNVRSPVNGYVTNLLMRVGDYAHQGGINVSVIDTDSYWIDGYFEETKLARVCIGDRVEAKLMGFAQPILGHVASVTRGIGVSDAAAGAQGLPNVNPVFTWVRLAQRVPIRIAIDHVPAGIPLVSGLSATVTIQEADAVAAGGESRLRRVIAAIETQLSDVLTTPPARAGCIPATTSEQATPVTLPVDTATSGITPEQINPGLAPGINSSPKKRS
jgi:multidrug resistance efflux pump